ncbi:hypothetical protein F8S13_01635 [Chloroflexia bacterium SDU3-3]|nr:hypothetical protein F8S13_01635 [Chloroflexia bacterium SDU3-3]
MPTHLPDHNALPEHLIALTEAVLDQTADVSAVWQEIGDLWYVVGNIEEEFTAQRDDVSLAVYYACDTALKACYEALNAEFLGDIRHWEQYTNEDVPDFARDTASSAMVANAGGGDVQPEDEERRLAFWRWWLGGAIPTAWEQAAQYREHTAHLGAMKPPTRARACHPSRARRGRCRGRGAGPDPRGQARRAPGPR